jgi:hypothetical protein
MVVDAWVWHWRHVVEVNLMSAVHVSHDSIPRMRPTGQREDHLDFLPYAV